MNKSEKISIFIIPIVLLIAWGISAAGSQNGRSINDFPIFSLGVIVAIAIQWIMFIPAYIQKTEKFFDITGGVTYITVIILSGLLASDLDTRTIIFMILIGIWATRLGTFLYRRIHKAGEDIRFAEIKHSFPRFLMTWTIQGLWVSLTLAAALAAITSDLRKDIDIFLIVGSIIWITGFIIEVVSDSQKSSFRAKPENKGKFISNGLWSRSRHPNYFGEILLWIGIAIIAIPVLQGWQFVTLISPLFVYLLLTRVSGIPMLEKSADERWGGQEDYEQYKKRTPVLFLKLN